MNELKIINNKKYTMSGFNKESCNSYPHRIHDLSCRKFHDPRRGICFYGHEINIDKLTCESGHVAFGCKDNILSEYYIAVIDEDILIRKGYRFDAKYKDLTRKFILNALEIITVQFGTNILLKKKIEDYRAHAKELYSEKMNLKRKRLHDDECEIKKQISDLKLQLDDLKMKSKTFKISVTLENDELKKLNKKQQEEIIKLNLLCDEFKTTFGLNDLVGDLMISLVKKNTNIQHEYNLLTSKITSLLSDNDHLTKTTHILESEIEKLNVQQITFNKINSSLKDECEKLKETNKIMDDKIKKYKSAFSIFGSDL